MKKFLVPLLLLLALTSSAQVSISDVPKTNKVMWNDYMLVQQGSKSRTVTVSNLLDSMIVLPQWSNNAGGGGSGTNISLTVTSGPIVTNMIATTNDLGGPQNALTVQGNAKVNGNMTVGTTTGFQDPYLMLGSPGQSNGFYGVDDTVQVSAGSTKMFTFNSGIGRNVSHKIILGNGLDVTNVQWLHLAGVPPIVTNNHAGPLTFHDVLVSGLLVNSGMPVASGTAPIGVGIGLGGALNQTRNGQQWTNLQWNSITGIPAAVTNGASGNLSQSYYYDHGGLRYMVSNNVAWINVMDYIPDNATVDQTTVGIQTAIDLTTNSYYANNPTASTTNSHSVVYFPNGTYPVNKPLRIRVHGTKLLGEGGWNRTRIVQTANTNLIQGDPWIGWNEGGNILWGIEFNRLALEMTNSFGTANRACGFYFASVNPADFLWRRVVVRDCIVSHFYIGIRGYYGVGLQVENTEVQNNCFNNWLTKFDKVTYVNCSVGGSYDGATWGTNAAVDWTWDGAANFGLVLIGCEAGDSRQIIKAAGGDVVVLGMNVELDNVPGGQMGKSYGPAFDFGAGVMSATLLGLRVSSIQNYGNSTNPIFSFKGGTGQRALITGSGIEASGYPTVRLDTPGDYINNMGSPMFVTNTADAVSWYAPFATNRVVVAGPTVTKSQAGPVTTYTVGATGGGGDGVWTNSLTGFASATPNPLAYSTNAGQLIVPSGYTAITSNAQQAFIEFVRTNGSGTELDYYTLAASPGKFIIASDGEYHWEANFNRTNGSFWAPSVRAGSATITNASLVGPTTLNGTIAMPDVAETSSGKPLWFGAGPGIVGWNLNGSIWTNLTAANLAGTIAAMRMGVTNEFAGPMNTSSNNVPSWSFNGGALTNLNITNIYEFALSDETTPLTTGTKVTWRAPHAMTLKGVRASVTTASSSGIPTVDIRESGVTIFSTKLTIDQSEKTSTTAATAYVFSDTSIADDAELTFIVDTIAGTGTTGLKVKLYYTR